MFSFGFGKDRTINYLGGFNPLNIDGLQLYLDHSKGVTSNITGANVSSWVDQSVNAFVFSNGIVTAQPLKGVSTVNSDGINDFLLYSGVNPLNDNSGILFFKVYFDGINQAYIMGSGDQAGTNGVSFRILNTGKINFLTIGGTTTNLSSSQTATVGFNYGYVLVDGTDTYFSLNGGTKVITPTAGDIGQFYGDIPGRDNLTIGALIRSTSAYIHSSLSGLIYTNIIPSDDEIDKINNFMSTL